MSEKDKEGSNLNYPFLDTLGCSEKRENKEDEINEPSPLISFSNTEIAMDNSGSTSGTVLFKSKGLISKILSDNEDKSLLEKEILAWGSSCVKQELSKITSNGGGTEPSHIFDLIKSTTENLIITTDGEIFESDLECTRKKLNEHKHLKNIVSILVMDSFSPASLNLSVFFPFMEHALKMGGCFYLLCERTQERGKKLYLLMKKLPMGFKEFDRLPAPIEEFTPETSWEKVPKISYDEVDSILVPGKYYEIKSGEITLKDGFTSINLVEMSEKLTKLNNEGKNEILLSDVFTSFIKNEFPYLIEQAIDYLNREAIVSLRKILQLWKKVKHQPIDKEINDLRKKCDLNHYEKLSNEKLNLRDKDSEKYKKIIKELAELSEKIHPLLQKIEQLKNEKSKPFLDIYDPLIRQISEAENGILLLKKPNDFTLQNVTKNISNRAKRAEMISASNKAEDWDLSGNNVNCKECLICCRENLPCGLLMVDLLDKAKNNNNNYENEDDKVLGNNLSNEALNDQFTTGMKNSMAVPAGEFCIDCAYALLELGKHPMTREKIASVLVLCNPFKGSNSKLISRSICASIFGGKSIPSNYQILLGIFDQIIKAEQGYKINPFELLLKKKRVNKNIPSKTQKTATRFSQEVYNYVKHLAINIGKGNLLGDKGESKNLLLAMYDVVNFGVEKTDPETWLVPIRNKSISSVSLICRSLIENFNLLIKKGINISLKELMEKSVTLMRRTFILECSKYITELAKEREKVNRFKLPDIIYDYSDFIFRIESDLFDNSKTGIPLSNSAKVLSYKNSENKPNIPAIFSCLNDSQIKEYKYFENFIRNIYEKNKDNKKVNEGDCLSEFKDFEILSRNLIVLLTLAIYKIMSQKNSQNDISIKNENFLKKIFVNIKYKQKNDKLKQLQQEINDVFFEGNFGHLQSLTEKELIEYINLASPYSKIQPMENDHLNFIPQFSTHCYSAPVTACSVCSEEFITEEEKNKILNNLNNSPLPENDSQKRVVNRSRGRQREGMNEEIIKICEKVKERRNLHFKKMYGSRANDLLPGKNNVLVSYHEIVRKILFKRRYVQCKNPNRPMIEEMINYAISKDEKKKGNIYREDLAERLLCLTVDLLNKRNSQRAKGRKMLSNKYATFDSRVIYEIKGGKDSLFLGKPATLEGVRKELIDKCLTSFEHFPKSKTTYIRPIIDGRELSNNERGGPGRMRGLRRERRRRRPIERGRIRGFGIGPGPFGRGRGRPFGRGRGRPIFRGRGIGRVRRVNPMFNRGSRIACRAQRFGEERDEEKKERMKGIMLRRGNPKRKHRSHFQ